MPLICIKRDTNASIQNHCHESWFNNFSIWPIFYSWRVCIIKNGIETIFYAKMNVIRVASSAFFSVDLFDRCLLCWKSYLKRIFCTLDQIQFEKSQSIEPIKYCSSTKMEENEFTCESYFVLHRGSANKQMLPSISYLRCFTWKATARIALFRLSVSGLTSSHFRNSKFTTQNMLSLWFRHLFSFDIFMSLLRYTLINLQWQRNIHSLFECCKLQFAFHVERKNDANQEIYIYVNLFLSNTQNYVQSHWQRPWKLMCLCIQQIDKQLHSKTLKVRFLGMICQQ